jgi:short-subunit dehydrogenase
MTEKFKKGVLWARPNTVAKKIVLAIDNKKAEVYVPFFWCLVMLIIKVIPQKIFKKMML